MRATTTILWQGLLLAGLLTSCSTPEPVRRPGPHVPSRAWLKVQPADQTETDTGDVHGYDPDRSDLLAGVRLVLDAGHGGRDPGAISVTGMEEADFNLDMVRAVARALQVRGADVVMTRSTDRFLELSQRAAIAQREHADVFVSIPADAARNPAARGPTVYIAEGASPMSRRVAKAIDGRLRAAGLPSRGVREARYQVLVRHTRPAVLLECGYLSNVQDEAQLRDPGHRAMLVDLIVGGLVDALVGGRRSVAGR